MKKISLIYKTFQGAWAVHGVIGYRQYMGYSKTESKAKYLAECDTKIHDGTNADGTNNIMIK